MTTPETRTRRHMSASLQGMLRMTAQELEERLGGAISDDKGRELHDGEEIRALIEAEIAKGYRYAKCSPHCFGFDPVTGCPGHIYTIHRLKTWPAPFQAVVDGIKKHEVRKNDRGFKVGDALRLEEWIPDEERYTGKAVNVIVTHITEAGSFGLPADICVMSVEKES